MPTTPGLYLTPRRYRVRYPDLARLNTFTCVPWQCIRVLCRNRHIGEQRRADDPNKKETEDKKMSTFYISHKNYLFVNATLQVA